MKGVLSKRQRERKKMREIVNYVNKQQRENWTDFVSKANRGNKMAEIKQDRDYVKKILEDEKH